MRERDLVAGKDAATHLGKTDRSLLNRLLTLVGRALELNGAQRGDAGELVEGGDWSPVGKPAAREHNWFVVDRIVVVPRSSVL